jgi:hypothetical protein
MFRNCHFLGILAVVRKVEVTEEKGQAAELVQVDMDRIEENDLDMDPYLADHMVMESKDTVRNHLYFDQEGRKVLENIVEHHTEAENPGHILDKEVYTVSNQHSMEQQVRNNYNRNCRHISNIEGLVLQQKEAEGNRRAFETQLAGYIDYTRYIYNRNNYHHNLPDQNFQQFSIVDHRVMSYVLNDKLAELDLA